MATLKNTVVNDTGYLKLPSGTDAQRPGTPEAGMMRWNTTSSGVEVYDGTAWGSVGSSDADTLDGIDSTGFVKNNCSQTNHVLMFGAGYNTSHGDCAYAIFQEGGTWSYPYPDLRIAYHTGIKIGANTSYQGTRFYNDYNMATELFSVGNGDNNVRVAYNLYAPIFYDSNNTGYYVDPASTSNFNTICAANYCGLPASGGGQCQYCIVVNGFSSCTVSPGKSLFVSINNSNYDTGFVNADNYMATYVSNNGWSNYNYLRLRCISSTSTSITVCRQCAGDTWFYVKY
jgi:hypothetical protein